jgi:hypothetical protein
MQAQNFKILPRATVRQTKSGQVSAPGKISDQCTAWTARRTEMSTITSITKT